MTAVIMAGGKGTRLQPLSKDIPKPMFLILGKPILEYQIESLRKNGITDIIIIIGYLGDIIINYFRDGKDFGVNIRYITELEPLGSAGALYFLKDNIAENRYVKDDFFLIFGDLLLDIDWKRFMGFHKRSGGVATLYVHPNTHPYDSDIVIIDANDKILKIESKNIKRDFFYHNIVNAGVYCVNPVLLNDISQPIKTDFEKDILIPNVRKGKIYAYKSAEYVKDMGTPDRLRLVTEDVKNGVILSRSLRNKQKAIFFDRDGTLNVYKGFLKRVEDFELYPDVIEAVQMVNNSNYLAIVATNQPVIARGECSYCELDQIHMKMETLLGEKGAYLDDLFFCPHHPDKGFDGEVSELKVECDCRKPKIGMLLRAAEKYNIDLKESWYIGDSTVDIQTGNNACMRTVLVKTGLAGKDCKFEVKPDVVADNLLEAVQKILSLQ